MDFCDFVCAQRQVEMTMPGPAVAIHGILAKEVPVIGSIAGFLV